MHLIKKVELEHQIAEAPVLIKVDDTEIPNFTKEIPSKKSVQDTGQTTIVSYKWSSQSAPSEVDSLKISKIEMKKGDLLSKISRITIRDGMENLVLRLKGTLYLLRKTTEEVARSLLRASFKLRLALEEVVGYLKTVLGNTYVISKVDSGSWTFDRRIAVDGLNHVNIKDLDASHRERLVELITERIAALHSSRLVLGIKDLSNILLTGRDAVFTDLRKLRISRRPELLVGEFISLFRYLFSSGIASHADVAHAVSYYSVAAESQCSEWHRDKSRKRNADHFSICTALEKEILSN